METVENTKLIAEFIGYVITEEFIHGREKALYFKSHKHSNSIMTGRTEKFIWEECYKQKLLKFYTSWDYLMPVVEKIKSLNVQIRMYSFIDKSQVIKIQDWQGQSIVTVRGEDTIKVYYKAVVEFIKWYNEK